MSSEITVALAQQVWQVLEPVIQSKPLAIGAATVISEDILDEEAQAIFCQQVEKLLAEDAALATSLTEIINGESVAEARATLMAEGAAAASEISQTVTGDLNVVVGQADSVSVDQSQQQVEIIGDVSNSPIIVGDGNVIQQAAPRPTGMVNPFGVPYSRNRYFTGRAEVLSLLHEQLMLSGTVAMTQVQAISGLGGIGKTQTAVEYAYRYYYGSQAATTETTTETTEKPSVEKQSQQTSGQDSAPAPVYDYVFWINADTQVNLATDYAAISEQLAVPDAQAMPQEQKITAVRSWLNGHDRWLLIFDNADTPDWLAPWMPTNPTGKVLITSRASVFDQLGIQTPIALDVLSEAEALTLLFERTGIERTAAAEDEAKLLNQELDGLPLALEQASAYILRQKIGFGTYLRAYRSRGLT
ncbi:MAG: NB-ARC domain-containing protein, partial [Cyanobacteria bacterium J06607_13]